LLKESRRFPTYNYRKYATDRVKYGFHQHENERNPKMIEELMKKAEESLQMMRRQTTIGNMYVPEKLVIENTTKPIAH
jgi:hypothetical protein